MCFVVTLIEGKKSTTRKAPVGSLRIRVVREGESFVAHALLIVHPSHLAFLASLLKECGEVVARVERVRSWRLCPSCECGCGFKVVKGVAEMKSRNTVVNGQAKMARLGLLSLLTGMVLNLSLGTALYAADEFKLWKLDAEGKAGARVELALDTKKTEAATLLKSEVDTEPNVSEFVKLEPTVAFEGLRKFLVDSKAPAEQAAVQKDKMEKILASLNKLGTNKFTSPAHKAAFITLIEKIGKMSIEDLENLSPEEFLRIVFMSQTGEMKELGLTDVKKEIASNPVIPPTPVNNTVGEVDDEVEQSAGLSDAEIEALVKPICDKHNALVEKSNRELQDMQDLVKEVQNKVAALSQIPPQVVKRDQAEDVIGPLLKQLAKDNQPAPAAAAAPVAPQVASTQSQPEEEPVNPNSALNALPPAPNSQVGQPAPFFATPQSNSARPQIALDLPSNRGARDLRTAQEAIAAADDVLSQGVPTTINPYTGMSNNPLQVAAQLGASKAQVDGALANVNSAIKTTNKRMQEMDGQLEQLKDGARAALPEWVSKEEARLQGVYDTAKRNFEQQRQQLTASAQASGDPNAMAQVATTLGGMSQEMSRAETDLKGFQAEVEAKLVTGNKAIAQLKSQRQALEDSYADLKTQKGKLDVQNTQIANLLTSNGQQFAQMSQPGVGTPGPNVNRISGANIGNTARGRGIGGALSTDVRGNLGTASTVGGTVLR